MLVKWIPRANLDLAAAMCIVGSSVVVGKLITNQFPIFMALMIRFAIGLPILIALSYRSSVLSIPPKKVLVQIFLQALTGVFLYNVLLLIGLRYTSASQGGLLTSTVPAVIIVLGWMILREPVTRYELGGVALSALGVVVINMIGAAGDLSMSQTRLIGNALVFGAVICEALFTIFRKATKEVPAMLGATWVTGFGLLLCLPLGLQEMASYDWHSITLVQTAALIYYGTFVSVLGYYLWFRGVEGASVGAIGILSGLLPVSTVVLSALLLGERLTTAHLVGLLLVLSAIGMMSFGPYLVARKLKPHITRNV